MKRIILLLTCLLFFQSEHPAQTVTDYDGNVYAVVMIGDQAWLQENLKTTHYRNGVAIPNVPGGVNWAGMTTGARCYYNNDSSAFDSVYGPLYNWYAVHNSNGRCPEGWHVPTDGEWMVAENYLGGSEIAGGKMKEAGTFHWLSPNVGATNSSGFTGLPGGMLGTAYTFQALGENGLWWTSTMQQPATAWSRYLWYLNAGVDRNPVPKTIPLSIRCIRDAGVGLGKTDRPVIRIFPNPARDKISIELSGRREANVAVHDLSGRDVFHGTVVVKSSWIDISGLAPGIYLITLTGSFRTVTEKFSKE